MPIDLRNPGRTLHAGVILTKGITEMIDVAPFEFLAGLGEDDIRFLGYPAEMCKDAIDLKVHWVTEDGGLASMSSGAQIKPTDSFATCPPLDIALMGAHNPGYHISDGERAFIRKTFEDCSAFLSICGGIISLLEAGLLEGKTVAVPRMLLALMEKTAPNVKWMDKRWTKDGKIWSSSTLLNGTDLMRAFTTEVWGGKNGMIEARLDTGHWPIRDVDFKDDHGKVYPITNIGL